VADRWETGRIEAFSDAIVAIAIVSVPRVHGDGVPAGSA
jgi:hypothetical protein